MRALEVDSWEDYFQYFGEIYNPFGYISFILDEDRDWGEKAEHSAFAYATIGGPFHILAAMSEGGWLVNRPPGHIYRSIALKKAISEHFYKVMQRISLQAPRVASKFGVASARAVPAVYTGAAIAGAAVATHDVAQGAVTQGREKPAWIPLPIWATLWS